MASELANIQDVYNHDVFNIIALAIIGPLDLYYLWYATEWDKMGTNQLGADHVELAQIVLYLFLAYLVIDVLWIIMVPSCVQAKPGVIVLHHACTLLLVAIPILDNRWCWHGMIDLVSEINTLFLTIRRNLTLNGPSYNVANFFFYLTWVLSRVLLFPALGIFFLHEHSRLSKELGTSINIYMVGPVLQFLLVVFSYYWTYLMIIKRGKAPDIPPKKVIENQLPAKRSSQKKQKRSR